MEKLLILKKGRDRSAQRRHPWIFSGAVAELRGDPQPGEDLLVRSIDGHPLGRAAYSPYSQIRARFWSFDPEEAIDAAFFKDRLQAALERRRRMLGHLPQAFRWVHGESDGLPGLVVDVYGDYVVCQILSAGVELNKAVITAQLGELWPAKGIVERSDVAVRAKEGLSERVGLLAGSAPEGPLDLELGGLRFYVDLFEGHKTGHYLDQRENWARLGRYAQGRDCLNCFGYTGGFSLALLQGGAASLLQVEASAAANGKFKDNLALNGLDASRAETVEADVFKELRRFRDQGKEFDLILLDPPKFADTAAQLDRAARGYKDINLLAFKLLRPGGILASFSCSGAVSPELFKKILADAALDARRGARIIERLGPSPDHAADLAFPEGDYLKGLILSVD
ncbi:MAG: class I SAM-dependent methyltransferase [bacterium]|nr:class I SAM-dependent methyltransferase [bacterium]